MSKRAAKGSRAQAACAQRTAPLTPPCPLTWAQCGLTHCASSVRRRAAPLRMRSRPAGDQRANLWPSADQRPRITRSAGRAPSGGPPALS